MEKQGYLYLIITRESIRLKESVLKFGCSKNVHKRFKQYSKGSQLLFSLYVNDYEKKEKEILKELCKQFIQRKDYGSEYFEGNAADIGECVRNHCKLPVDIFGGIEKSELPNIKPSKIKLIKKLDDVPPFPVIRNVKVLDPIDLTGLIQTIEKLSKSDTIDQTVLLQTTSAVVKTMQRLQLHTFGNEYLYHITDDFLSICVLNKSEGILSLIQKIYRDPAIPENHNVRNKSEKKALMETYDNGTWILQDKNTVLDAILCKVHKILYDHNQTKMQTIVLDDDDFISKSSLNYTNLMYYQLRRNAYILFAYNNT